jgi:hypothetical protein
MNGRLAEARLDLGARRHRLTQIDNRQAALTIDELMSVGDLVKAIRNGARQWRCAASPATVTSSSR